MVNYHNNPILNDNDEQSEVHNKKRRDFKWKKKLGSGSFGEVTLCDWLAHDPPIEVAVKVVDKSKVIRSKEEQEKGMTHLRKLNHPNLIRLFDWFESKEHYYLVFELAEGGELYDQVESRGRFQEEEARLMIRDLLSAVIHFHSLHIIHRDLKLENIFLRSSQTYKKFPDSVEPVPIYHVLIADFGVCTTVTEDETPESARKLTNVCGSAGYIAPEIVEKRGYSYGADVWSIGIIAFLLMGGRFPFKAVIAPEFVEQAKKGVVFPTKTWKGVSDEAKDFIRYLLTFDPRMRPTATQAYEHKWLTSTTRTYSSLTPSNPQAPQPLNLPIANPDSAPTKKFSEEDTLVEEADGNSAAQTQASDDTEEKVGSPREKRVTIAGKEERVH